MAVHVEGFLGAISALPILPEIDASTYFGIDVLITYSLIRQQV
jgi:hypothetical protein